MPRDNTLWKRLESARTAELQKLADIVGLPNATRQADSKLVEELSKAIRSAAGHSFRNLFRKENGDRIETATEEVMWLERWGITPAVYLQTLRAATEEGIVLVPHDE